MISFNSFIADELAHKNKYLSQALEQANHIIEILEEENLRLKTILSSISYDHPELENVFETKNDTMCTI
jgi:hypothetical protein